MAIGPVVFLIFRARFTNKGDQLAAGILSYVLARNTVEAIFPDLNRGKLL